MSPGLRRPPLSLDFTLFYAFLLSLCSKMSAFQLWICPATVSVCLFVSVSSLCWRKSSLEHVKTVHWLIFASIQCFLRILKKAVHILTDASVFVFVPICCFCLPFARPGFTQGHSLLRCHWHVCNCSLGDPKSSSGQLPGHLRTCLWRSVFLWVRWDREHLDMLFLRSSKSRTQEISNHQLHPWLH